MLQILMGLPGTTTHRGSSQVTRSEIQLKIPTGSLATLFAEGGQVFQD